MRLVMHYKDSERGNGLVSVLIWIAIMLIVGGTIATALKTSVNNAEGRTKSIVNTYE